MNSQRFITILTFLVITSAVSGCVLPGRWPFEPETQAGAGVVIEHFGPDFPEVYSGEEVSFALKVKNTGSVKAENGFAELLGLDQIWGHGKNTAVSQTGEVFPDEVKCRHTNKGIILLPEEPESSITGGEETCTWRYIAPAVMTGLSTPYKAKVRFFYSYSSTTVKTITLVSREELKALQSQGKSLPTESQSKTKSPISLDVEAESPIRTYGDGVEFPIVITLKNIGGGTVCSSVEKCKKSEWAGGEWNLEEGWYNFDVEIYTPAGMELRNCERTENVVLIGDEPQTISCKIIADISQQVGIVQKNIELRAKYGYFIDKAADVLVYPSTKPRAVK